MRPSLCLCNRAPAVLLALALSGGDRALAQFTSYDAVSRFGAASTLAGSNWIIHGGQTAMGSALSSDLLSLGTASSFDLSDPPWQKASSTSDPPIAFHSLSTLGSSILSFGGESTSSPLPSANDSAWLLSPTSGVWTTEAKGWANQPIRRERHSAVVQGGTAYIFGGVKADGSGLAFDELWSFDGTSFSFVETSGTTPPATYDATLSVIDSNLYLIGGVTPTASPTTLASMSTIYRFNTATGAWASITASGTVPAARRGHVAVALDSSRILIHGGASGDGTTVMSMMAILTVSSDGGSAVWSTVTPSGSAAPSARWEHNAALVGSTVLIAFGALVAKRFI